MTVFLGVPESLCLLQRVAASFRLAVAVSALTLTTGVVAFGSSAMALVARSLASALAVSLGGDVGRAAYGLFLGLSLSQSIVGLPEVSATASVVAVPPRFSFWPSSSSMSLLAWDPLDGGGDGGIAPSESFLLAFSSSKASLGLFGLQVGRNVDFGTLPVSRLF